MNPLEIRSAVDRVVFRDAAYAPLELLLELGWLAFPDYLSWRLGERSRLDDCLPPRSELASLLTVAADHAHELGFVPAAADQPDLPARTTGTPALDTWLLVRFERSGGAQLDLFIDSATTVRASELRGALLQRDAVAARAAMATLRAHAPAHALLDPAAVLLESLAPAERGLALIGRIERDWQPAAERVLGTQARDFVAPLWQAAARCLDAAADDPTVAQSHPSYAYLQIRDWHAVVETVTATPTFMQRNELVERLAIAERRLGRRDRALQWLGRLALDGAAQGIALLERRALGDPLVERYWDEFRSRDFEPDVVWFPAWMVIAEPGLAHVLAELAAAAAPIPAQSALDAAIRLARRHGDAITERRRLKSLHAGLFDFYMTYHTT